MGKQIVKKTVGVLLAVLFLLSLSAASVSAAVPGWIGGFVPSSAPSCAPNCGCGWDCVRHCCLKKCAGPTWQECFAAFQNDGFECWRGCNDLGIGLNGLLALELIYLKVSNRRLPSV